MSKRAKKALRSLTPAILAFFALAPYSSAQEMPAWGAQKGLGTFGQGAQGRWLRQGKWQGQWRNRMQQRGGQGIENGWSGAGKPQLKEILVDGIKRNYYFYKPATARTPAPLVLAFHGGGGTAAGVDKCAGGLAKLADKNGFIVVFPDGIEKHWNDGRPDISKTSYDDVGFISKLIDQLKDEKLIDPKRVYATGISNGGFFSQYLAIHLPGKIAAVATVAASVSKAFLDLNVSPVPIMMLLGTEDTLVPWNGGKIGGKILPRGRGEVLSGQESLQFWLEKNRNAGKPICTTLPDKDKSDGSQVVVEQYGAPGSSNEVVLYEIRGGGHTWPDGQQYLPKRMIGPVCGDFNGNETIWNFFEKHSLKSEQ